MFPSFGMGNSTSRQARTQLGARVIAHDFMKHHKVIQSHTKVRKKSAWLSKRSLFASAEKRQCPLFTSQVAAKVPNANGRGIVQHIMGRIFAFEAHAQCDDDKPP